MSRRGLATTALVWAAVLTSAGALMMMSLLAPSTAAAIPPEEAYQLHCSGCHRADGSGDPRIVPSLRTLAPLVAAADGRSYLIRVPGVAQAPLPDAELATLLDWVLENFSGMRGFEAFSTEEVAAARLRPLRDPLAERARILGSAGRAGAKDAESLESAEDALD